MPEGFLDGARRRSVIVTDRHGQVLYEALSGLETRSLWLSPENLPEMLVKATVAAEDRRFFRHPGLDPLAVARALWADLRARRLAEGGSTITQQVVKRLLVRRRTWAGKLREAVLALRLEHRLSKRDILALYLNLAPYGNQCEGAEAAALAYFGCRASELTPAQAALLAGLPQRPTAFDPHRFLPRALERQKTVLGRMRALGFLDEARLREALGERLALRRLARPAQATHLVQRLLADRDPDADQRLRTTLDLDLQRQVAGILSARRPDLQAHGAHNAAVLVLRNATGEVLAWEGSGDYFDPAHSGAVDGVTTPRQPGSALKPFTYALAFEHGLTPATALPDVPSHFPTAVEGVVYGPRNYDGFFRGPLRARKALAGSVNVPAVWALSRVGVAELLAFLRGLGFTTLVKTADHYGYGLTLGDAEVRLDELASAYACLARGGVHRPLSCVLGQPTAQRRVLSARSAFWVADILTDADARAFAFGRGGSLEFPFPVAVKTGTSEAYTDNWAVGFTREVTVAVWVGNFDRTPLRGSSGLTGAGPVFHDVLQAAERLVLGRLPGPQDPPIVEAPAGLIVTEICGLSGLAPSAACPTRTREQLPAGRLLPPCSWHARDQDRTVTLWPAEYRTWARSQGFSASRTAPGRAAALGPGKLPFAIENPPAGVTYWIDPTLRSEYQALELRVRTDRPSEPVTWSLDGAPLATAPADRPVHWALRPGDHLLEARDGGGRNDRVSFRVR